jgi:phage host-nuclease inhibitor protein Gam
MASKTKKVVIKNVSESAFNDSFQSYAILDARQVSILAKIDEKVANIRRQFEDELNQIIEQKEKEFEIVQVYCAENPQMFGKKKSFESLHGVVGFRTGTPKLKNLKGFTWASITNLLKEFFPEYVRKTEEPAKDLILANRETLSEDDLKKMGVEIIQDEAFYIELKKEVVSQ